MEGVVVGSKKTKLGGGHGRNLFDRLPDECVARVFEFLQSTRHRCACAAVSKKWLHLMATMGDYAGGEKMPVVSPTCSSMRLLNGKKANDLRLAALAVRSYPHRSLTCLCVAGEEPSSLSISDYGLEIIARASPRLKVLSLWGCRRVGDAGLKAVGRWCRDLETLHLINMPKITDHGLASIAKDCLKLSTVSIESCPLVGSGALHAMAEKSMNLKAVSLDKCPLVQDSGIVSVVTNLPELSRLELSGMTIGDEVLEAIRDRSTALQVLNLVKIKGPTSKGYSFIREMEKLKFLKLKQCVGLTGENLKGANFAALIAISIQGCVASLTDEVLMGLSKSAKLLRRLSLERCSGFTSRGIIEALSNWKDSLKGLSLNMCTIFNINMCGHAATQENGRLPRLTTIELNNCNGVGDEFLTRLGPACVAVKEVSLVGCNACTDQGLLGLMLHLIRRAPPSGIVSLDLSGCSAISGLAICAMMEVVGAALKLLRLRDCIGVDDWVVAMIAAKCSALENLNVDGCRITDRGLWCLVKKGKDRLQWLSLAGCAGITDAGMKYLEEVTWNNLKQLDVRNCARISRRGIDEFRSMIWWCKVLC